MDCDRIKKLLNSPVDVSYLYSLVDTRILATRVLMSTSKSKGLDSIEKLTDYDLLVEYNHYLPYYENKCGFHTLRTKKLNGLGKASIDTIALYLKSKEII